MHQQQVDDSSESSNPKISSSVHINIAQMDGQSAAANSQLPQEDNDGQSKNNLHYAKNGHIQDIIQTST